MVSEKPQEEPEPKTKPPKSLSTLLLQLLFSHVGLFIIVAIYAILGAYAFIEIERPNEARHYELKRLKAKDVNDALSYVTNFVWAAKDTNITKEEYRDLMYDTIKDLESFIITMVNDFSYDGTEYNWVWSWTFSNSLLLTMTIMTTIGYGHIYPVTTWGQIFCIIYAIIGCPLLLVFLANIGDAMANSFVYIYSRCCCRMCRARRYDSELPPDVSKKNKRLLIDDIVGKEDYMPTNEVFVPVTLNLVLLFVYIMLGGVLFSYWEDWDLSSSTYFTFVTLSTIGFGDMVPGRAIVDIKEGIGAIITMLLCIIYILLGMALLSMCINLMQEQLVSKVKWVAREIGVSKNNDTKSIAQENEKAKMEEGKTDKGEKKEDPPPILDRPCSATPAPARYDSPTLSLRNPHDKPIHPPRSAVIEPPDMTTPARPFSASGLPGGFDF
ncbi:TWiK family of potassium channels protein 7-like [Oratosquilla oratoria]|uniref:TWiK family of potassium channels protein 7-like n=1 Tax=Oratosquilla oratoria TaxID=337810 RepID=UPI003F75D6E1